MNAPSIQPSVLNHPNILVRDADASMAQYREIFGVEPHSVEVPIQTCRAMLFDFGGVIFEFFSPLEYLLNNRSGPHFMGVEYVADIEQVRAAIAARDIGIVSDHEYVLHTDAADSVGVSFEFFGTSFYAPDSPVAPVKPEAYWRDEHPLGLTGLKGYTVAVSDADAAASFFADFLSGQLEYEEERPDLGARAIGMKVANCTVELLAPTSSGSLLRELCRGGQGVRSMVMRTRDLGQVRDHFARRGIATTVGSAPNRIAVERHQSSGVVFEFAE